LLYIENVDYLVAKFFYFILDFICVRGVVDAPEDCPKTSVFLMLIRMKLVCFLAKAFMMVWYLSEEDGWILTWSPISILSSKSFSLTVTSNSLRIEYFVLPTQIWTVLWEGRRKVFLIPLLCGLLIMMRICLCVRAMVA
jgi:hypothetical protein